MGDNSVLQLYSPKRTVTLLCKHFSLL